MIVLWTEPADYYTSKYLVEIPDDTDLLALKRLMTWPHPYDEDVPEASARIIGIFPRAMEPCETCSLASWWSDYHWEASSEARGRAARREAAAIFGLPWAEDRYADEDAAWVGTP